MPPFPLKSGATLYTRAGDDDHSNSDSDEEMFTGGELSPKAIDSAAHVKIRTRYTPVVPGSLSVTLFELSSFLLSVSFAALLGFYWWTCRNLIDLDAAMYTVTRQQVESRADGWPVVVDYMRFICTYLYIVCCLFRMLQANRAFYRILKNPAYQKRAGHFTATTIVVLVALLGYVCYMHWAWDVDLNTGNAPTDVNLEYTIGIPASVLALHMAFFVVYCIPAYSHFIVAEISILVLEMASVWVFCHNTDKFFFDTVRQALCVQVCIRVYRLSSNNLLWFDRFIAHCPVKCIEKRKTIGGITRKQVVFDWFNQCAHAITQCVCRSSAW